MGIYLWRQDTPENIAGIRTDSQTKSTAKAMMREEEGEALFPELI